MHVESWRETSTPLLPAGALDDLDVEARAARWAEIIDAEEGQLWVAIRSGRIVGFCGIGGGRGDGNGFVDDGQTREYPLAGHPIRIVRFVR